jgi:uncharacterized protein YjiS (DUF1127 family)
MINTTGVRGSWPLRVVSFRVVSISAIGHLVVEWQRRASERMHLREIDDRLLQDMGITDPQAEAESRKPFWRK